MNEDKPDIQDCDVIYLINWNIFLMDETLIACKMSSS